MTVIGIQLVLLLLLWMSAVIVWYQLKKRKIHEDLEQDRQQCHQIFESLRKCVESCDERNR